MNAPLPESVRTALETVSLDDKYCLQHGRAFMSGVQALVRLPLLQRQRDAAAGLNFHATGKAVTPLGANMLKSSAAQAGTLIGLDKNCALEMVEAGGILTEYDKLIDRQIERAAITQTAGFAKIFTDASKILTTKA